MTATQIIAEIQALPPKGKAEVLRFARSLKPERVLAGAELEVLADRLAATKDEGEAVKLREEITEGFYGGN